MTEHEIVMMVGNLPADKIKQARDSLRKEAAELAVIIDNSRSVLRDTYTTINVLQRRAYVQGIDLD